MTSTDKKVISGIVVGVLAGIAMLIALFSFERVEPVSKGKILTISGFQDEVLEPGRYFVPPWEKLIQLDASTKTFTQPMTVVLQDKLRLKFHVRMRARIDRDPKVLNRMFDDIKIDDSTSSISLDRVHDVYGRMAIENKAREALSVFSIEEIQANYGKLSSLVEQAVLPALEPTPLELSEVMVTNVEFPDLVNKAIEQAKERELQIEREKAQNEIDLLKKENERALAEAEYQTRMTKAKTIRDESRTIAEGVTPELLEFRRLEIQEKFASHAGDGNFTFIPIEALSSTGAQVRMYQKQE